MQPNRLATERELDASTAAGTSRFSRTVRRVAPSVPLHLAIIGLALLWSIPTIALLVSSFRDPGAVVTSGWWNVLSEPLDLTFDNYRRVLEQRGMGRAFVNSLIIHKIIH